MNKGGYQIINFPEGSIGSGASFKIDGIWKLLTETTKPILISGGTPIGTDFYIPLHDEFIHDCNYNSINNTITFRVHSYTYTVHNDDTVTTPE